MTGTAKPKPKRGPQPTRKLVTLNLDREAANRLERMAHERGETAGEYVEHLLFPLLDAENGEQLYWYLIALSGQDNATVGNVCRKRRWQADQLLDVLIGDALERLDEGQGVV